MRLRRSDSSASQWILQSGTGQEVDDDVQEVRDQKRLRHLSAVLIRNLTLNPRHDHISSLLRYPAVGTTQARTSGTPPTTVKARASDDANLFLRSTSSNSLRRRLATSNVSLGAGPGSSGAHARSRPYSIAAEPAQDSHIAASSCTSDVKLVRHRRSSSSGLGLKKAGSVIAEEGSSSPSKPISSLDRPAVDSYFSPDAPALTSVPLPPSSTSAGSRLRSDSHASAMSTATTASGSTVRQNGSPSVDKDSPQAHLFASSASATRQRADSYENRPGQRHYSSDTQLRRDHRRRREALQRRLLDSAITLELVPPSGSGDEATGVGVGEKGRQRGNSTATTKPTNGIRDAMIRSESSSSIKGKGLSPFGAEFSSTSSSPRRPLGRGRTYSLPLMSPNNRRATPAPSSPDATFFVSEPCHGTMHPTFPVQRASFLLPIPGGGSGDASKSDGLLNNCDMDVDDWAGLRQDHIRVKVWVRQRVSDNFENARSHQQVPVDGYASKQEPWKLLLEWDVQFGGLVSLGRDPTTFPRLPPNTLIFAMQDNEYFTAPLPSRRESRRSASRYHYHDRYALSASSASDCSSSGSEESREGGAGGGSDDDTLHLMKGGSGFRSVESGNLSDPGRGGGGGSRFGASLRGSRKRADLARDAQVQAEEEQRRRRGLLEKSARETRMIPVADGLDIEKLVALEVESRQVVAQSRQTRNRIDLALEGSDGIFALQREVAELRDRVDDLVNVKSELELELEDTREDLVQRQQLLAARRKRLEAAQQLLEEREDRAQHSASKLEDDESTCSTIRHAAQARRTQLITLLSHIFPVEAVNDPPSFIPEVARPLLFSILNVALPNSSYPPAFSDEALSSALGYTAQVVTILAAYLGVPLHYPIKSLGSRSAVIDPISMMRGPRAFPLYGKGVDRYRFDYGVFLLNKNIEQLMYSQGLTVIDLRNTLPNLKSILLTMSYDPSHLEFTSTLVAPQDLNQFADETSHSTGDHEHIELDDVDSDSESDSDPEDVQQARLTMINGPSFNSTERPASPTSSIGTVSTIKGGGAPVGRDELLSTASSTKRSELKLFGGRGSTTRSRSSSGATTRDARGNGESVSSVVEKLQTSASTSVSPSSSEPTNATPTTNDRTAESPSSSSTSPLGKVNHGDDKVRNGGTGGGARASSGSKIASTLWSAVGYRE